MLPFNSIISYDFKILTAAQEAISKLIPLGHINYIFFFVKQALSKHQGSFWYKR